MRPCCSTSWRGSARERERRERWWCAWQRQLARTLKSSFSISIESSCGVVKSKKPAAPPPAQSTPASWYPANGSAISEPSSKARASTTKHTIAKGLALAADVIIIVDRDRVRIEPDLVVVIHERKSSKPRLQLLRDAVFCYRLACVRSRSRSMCARRGGEATTKHRNTETPKHRNTETPKHRNTETPKHRNTETPKHRNTESPPLR